MSCRQRRMLPSRSPLQPPTGSHVQSKPNGMRKKPQTRYSLDLSGSPLPPAVPATLGRPGTLHGVGGFDLSGAGFR